VVSHEATPGIRVNRLVPTITFSKPLLAFRRIRSGASLAAPGEVLVSSTVKDLVAGSGLEFEERGTHQLRRVPGDWRLFAVVV
jgi:hypothetical protein